VAAYSLDGTTRLRRAVGRPRRTSPAARLVVHRYPMRGPAATSPDLVLALSPCRRPPRVRAASGHLPVGEVRPGPRIGAQPRFAACAGAGAGRWSRLPTAL